LLTGGGAALRGLVQSCLQSKSKPPEFSGGFFVILPPVIGPEQREVRKKW
jgi:hypothetical protein